LYLQHHDASYFVALQRDSVNMAKWNQKAERLRAVALEVKSGKSE
jgi:hypothetical protein